MVEPLTHPIFVANDRTSMLGHLWSPIFVVHCQPLAHSWPLTLKLVAVSLLLDHDYMTRTSLEEKVPGLMTLFAED